MRIGPRVVTVNVSCTQFTRDTTVTRDSSLARVAARDRKASVLGPAKRHLQTSARATATQGNQTRDEVTRRWLLAQTTTPPTPASPNAQRTQRQAQTCS
ncbi:unnamed protein product [Lampetra planeri]